MLVIRSSDFEQSQIAEKIYGNPDEFIKDVSENIEIMFQSIRLFYTLLLQYLLARNAELFEAYVGNYFTDRVLVAMIQDIQKNITHSP